MKVYYSPFSPYVRKVLVVAHELGLADRIEKLPSAAHPVKRDKEIIAHNPLGQVPTFFTDDGRMLADSRVICEYLNDLAGGALYPASGDARWRALVDQSLGDGIIVAALLSRYETAVRPPEKLWKDWLDGQFDKIATGLAALESAVTDFGDRSRHRYDHLRLRARLSRPSVSRPEMARSACGDHGLVRGFQRASLDDVFGASRISGASRTLEDCFGAGEWRMSAGAAVDMQAFRGGRGRFRRMRGAILRSKRSRGRTKPRPRGQSTRRSRNLDPTPNTGSMPNATASATKFS